MITEWTNTRMNPWVNEKSEIKWEINEKTESEWMRNRMGLLYRLESLVRECQAPTAVDLSKRSLWAGYRVAHRLAGAVRTEQGPGGPQSRTCWQACRKGCWDVRTTCSFCFLVTFQVPGREVKNGLDQAMCLALDEAGSLCPWLYLVRKKYFSSKKTFHKHANWFWGVKKTKYRSFQTIHTWIFFLGPTHL